MGKSHKTGGGHHSKKPDNGKKKEKEKDKSNKEKKVVKGADGPKHKTQKSPKSATVKKKAGDGKSDKSRKGDKKANGGKGKSGKEKSGKEKSGKEKSGKEKSGKEKSGKEKTTKQSKPVPKKEETVESTATVADDVEEAEVQSPPKAVKVTKGQKKTSEVAEESCESKQSSGGGQSTAAPSTADSEKTEEGEETSTTEVTTTEGNDDEQSKEKKHKSKAPKEKKKVPEEKEKKTKKQSSPPKLEFTKPTINQMVREEERQKHPKPPLVDTEKITRYEFEAFNDEVEEMNSSLQMLRCSYGSIITSLVAMYTKRGKRGHQAQLPPTVDGKANLLTPVNAAGGADVQAENSILDDADKYNIENFINPGTRETAFNALFAEVELLNKKTDKFRSAFFDKKGYFLLEKYEGQKEVKLSRKKLNHFWLWTRKLTEVIDEIARNYNDDLLNMFRLH